MFTSIKALRASNAQQHRVTTVETNIKKLLGAKYTPEALFPVYLVGQSNAIDDVGWVLHSRSAAFPQLKHLSLSKENAGAQVVSQMFDKKTKADAIRTLDALYLKDLSAAHQKEFKQIDGPEFAWLFAVMPPVEATAQAGAATPEAVVEAVAPTPGAAEVAEVAPAGIARPRNGSDAIATTQQPGSGKVFPPEVHHTPDNRFDTTISQAQNMRVAKLAAWGTSKEKRQKFLETLDFKALLFAAARADVLKPGVTDDFIKENIG